MNNKNIFLICIAFLLVAAFSFFISAADVCCEKTNSGAWCQLTDKSECASGYSQASTSCEQTLFCKKGTCINENTGLCSSNTPKGLCENDGGTWSNKNKDEIPACKLGCCILGQEVSFVNPTTCQQLATDYGVDVDFREDITSQSQCFSLDTTVDEGACVLEESATTSSEAGFFSNLFGGEETQETTSQTSIDCKRTTQSGCASLGGSFHKGLLCSAQELSDCAKSKETICEDDKVYFKDTCGNKANIYDENKYNNVNYWNEIQNSECSVGGVASSTCGDCSYRLGTICAEYDKSQAGKGMPNQAPSYGENVCRELSCYYDTNQNGKTENSEKYSHGESWCAESPGTFFHIPYIMDDSTKNKLREGYNDYNLPGSRYSKLKCYDGEVIVEPCKEFRNSVCKEAVDALTNKRVAACFINEGSSCLTYLTKSSCEKIDSCKWLPGYNLVGTVVGDGELEFGTKLKEYNEKQGTCYPIFAPGTDFWSGDGEAYCSKINSVLEKPLFETGILKSREKFAEDSTKEAANLCIDGCYAIPGYGSKDGTKYYDIETLKEFQLETKTLDDKVQDVHLSKREGYYCKKKPDEPDTIDNTKTGGEKGDDTDCTSGSDDEKDLERRRVKPFYTHEQWLKTIRERTRSSGDCGYKPHAYSSITKWSGDPDSEVVTVIFEKLKQSKEAKELIGEKIVLYKGDEKTPRAGYRDG